MARFCLTLLAPPFIGEKLLDLLLETDGDTLFTSASTSVHGLLHARLSGAEQVLGRSAAMQVQVLLEEAQMNELLQRLRDELPRSGLRYWASPLAVEGSLE